MNLRIDQSIGRYAVILILLLSLTSCLRKTPVAELGKFWITPVLTNREPVEWVEGYWTGATTNWGWSPGQWRTNK